MLYATKHNHFPSKFCSFQEQGLDNLVREQLKPFEMQSLGEFIRWVYNDIIKEEVDTIVANGFDPKKLGGPVANKARLWYINKFNAEG